MAGPDNSTVTTTRKTYTLSEAYEYMRVVERQPVSSSNNAITWVNIHTGGEVVLYNL